MAIPFYQNLLQNFGQPSVSGLFSRPVPQLAQPKIEPLALNEPQANMNPSFGGGATGLDPTTAGMFAGQPPAAQPKSADMSQIGGAIGSLAAAPLAIGMTQVRGVERGPNPAVTALNAQVDANTRSARGLANANPNVNPALQQRNAAEAAMRANLAAGAGAQSAIQQREIEKSQARQQRVQAGLGTAGQLLNTAATVGSFFSDIRLKDNVQPAQAPVQQTMDMLSGAGPQQFDNTITGRHEVGPMAQTFAASPVAEQTAGRDPQTGAMTLDGNGVTQFNTAAIAELNRRLNEAIGPTMQQFVQSQGGPPPAPPRPVESAAGLSAPPPGQTPFAGVVPAVAQQAGAQAFEAARPPQPAATPAPAAPSQVPLDPTPLQRALREGLRPATEAIESIPLTERAAAGAPIFAQGPVESEFATDAIAPGTAPTPGAFRGQNTSLPRSAPVYPGGDTEDDRKLRELVRSQEIAARRRVANDPNSTPEEREEAVRILTNVYRVPVVAPDPLKGLHPIKEGEDPRPPTKTRGMSDAGREHLRREHRRNTRGDAPRREAQNPLEGMDMKGGGRPIPGSTTSRGELFDRNDEHRIELAGWDAMPYAQIVRLAATRWMSPDATPEELELLQRYFRFRGAAEGFDDTFTVQPSKSTR